MLIDAGVKTNVHYVLGRNTIDEALIRLERQEFPEGMNAVLFLLHKPVGLGSAEQVLSTEDPRVQRFFEIIDQAKYRFKAGLDSCTVPGTIKHCRNLIMQALDTCEGGRFSAYIGADMDMLPCSFDQAKRFAVPLRDSTIEEVWNSPPFNAFRTILEQGCPECAERANCMGGCPLMPEIVLCNREEIRRQIQ
jgi:radical SAM protein with 4Fe4S-binding SPASM domain